MTRRIPLGYSNDPHRPGTISVEITLETLPLPRPVGPGLPDFVNGHRLSIVGHEPGGGGQMQDRLLDAIDEFYVPRERIERLVALWKRWHLNDMRAGCAHQRAEGWAERPIDPEKPTNAYGKHHPRQRQDSWNMLVWVYPHEVPGGLMTAPCPTCGYRYGSQWLYEPLPDEIVRELEVWPEEV